jgi:hypothetical protein
MGIILIELLISGAMGTVVDPSTFPFEARDKVDSEDPDDLSAVVQALSAKGGWTGGDAQRAAKILADVAVVCTRGTTKRQTPAQVLDQPQRRCWTRASPCPRPRPWLPESPGGPGLQSQSSRIISAKP